jgi:lipooligosaccharide transport system permease protein
MSRDSGRSRVSLHISRRFLHVWRRNLKVYGKIWKINFVPPILEPLFYLFAFGAGLGVMVGALHYRGLDLSYVAYLAPALIAINIMYNAFFETTFASFTRMYYQKTYDAIVATPLSLEEVVTGDVVWAATKAVMATAVMMSVITVFGLFAFPSSLLLYPSSLLILPVAFLGGMAFAGVGMLFTALVPSIDTFNLPMFLFITPMFLFSGTFFPLDNLPRWVQILAEALPLTHLVRLCRFPAYGLMDPQLLWSTLYLVGFTAAVFPLAAAAMQRRIIK